MKKDLYYTNPRKKTKRKKKKDISRPRLLSEDIRSTYFLLLGTIGTMIVILVLGYLYVSSQTSAKGYLLKQLQIDYEDLTAESKELDTQLLEVTSISNIDEENPVEDMERPQDEEFSFIETGNEFAQTNP